MLADLGGLVLVESLSTRLADSRVIAGLAVWQTGLASIFEGRILSEEPIRTIFEASVGIIGRMIEHELGSTRIAASTISG